MKNTLGDFIKSMDELDAAIAEVSKAGAAPDEKDRARLLEAVKEKSAAVRMHGVDLDARIERTVTEWEDLKKNEIGLKTLETQLRRSLHQE
jgi:hypothetical protein